MVGWGWGPGGQVVGWGLGGRGGGRRVRWLVGVGGLVGDGVVEWLCGEKSITHNYLKMYFNECTRWRRQSTSSKMTI